MPSVLFDAVALPEGADAAERLAIDGRAVEFVKDQYRHCKTILVLDGAGLLEKAGIPSTLPSGQPDPGFVLGQGADTSVLNAFVEALAKHRHFDRESDPPLV